MEAGLEEKIRGTSLKMAKEAYSQLLKETERFINQNSLEMFGAGISGVGLPDYKLAELVLDFIYEQNCKEDLRILKERIKENERF